MSDLTEKLRIIANWDAKGNQKHKTDCVTWKAADLIEQQQARIAELEAKTSCCMGVGNGNGRLFVYGDHESIKTAQRYVLEREELAATVERLKVDRDKIQRSISLLFDPEICEPEDNNESLCVPMGLVDELRGLFVELSPEDLAEVEKFNRYLVSDYANQLRESSVSTVDTGIHKDDN